MKVFVDYVHRQTNDSIDVVYADTVLTIKEKIERYLHIPVSKQNIYFKGRCLLNDNLSAAELNIVLNSRLQLHVYLKKTKPSHNSNQVLRQTEQSPAPSSSTQPIIHGQDWPVMVRRDNSQVLHQTGQFPSPSNSTGGIIYNQDWPMMVGRQNNQVLLGSQDQPLTNQEINYGQESSVMVRSNNNESEWVSGVPGFLNIEDHLQPVTVRSSINMNQVLQTEQSQVPSDSFERLLGTQDQPLTNQEFNYGQESSVMVRSNNNESEWVSAVPGFLNTEDHLQPVTVGSSINMNQVLQTEQSQVPSDSFERLLGTQDQPLTSQEIYYGQESSVMVRNNEFERPSLRQMEELLGVQDYLPSVTVGSSSNTNQVFQTEQSRTSDSVNEIIYISDSPVTTPPKLTVMVKPSYETREILVEVNAGDNVRELRNELINIQQRGELNLPQEGYYFVHNSRALDDDQSFWQNGVAHGDTIEIFPEYVTGDDSTTT